MITATASAQRTRRNGGQRQSAHPRRPAPFEHVLVATDFSAGAALALARALRLPIARRGRLDIVHACDDGSAWSSAAAPQNASQRLEGARAQAAAELAAQGRSDITVGAVLCRGLAHAEVVRSARLDDADIIVLGAQGARALANRLFGSTVERVIRSVELPVLVVKRAPQREYCRPLLALELTDSSVPLITTATSILAADVKMATMLHAYVVPFGGYPPPAALDQQPELAHRYRQSVTSRLAALRASARGLGVKWRASLVEAEPCAAILAEAVRRRADLIVVGTHGRTGFAHMLAGSVAERVIRRASCDVLVGRPARTSFELP